LDRIGTDTQIASTIAQRPKQVDAVARSRTPSPPGPPKRRNLVTRLAAFGRFAAGPAAKFSQNDMSS
jgi:hypothetical protein